MTPFPSNLHTLAALPDLLGGQWLTAPPTPQAPWSGASIDTRTLTAGNLFFALPGERVDGRAFINQAFQQGASAAIVGEMADVGWRMADGKTSDDAEPADPSAIRHPPSAILQVSDPVAALQKLASVWRDRLTEAGVAVVAVGGSNGKTTCRHLIHTALSAGLPGTQSPKSFNNHLGVPLTLLAAREDHDFVVAELGTNHPGEIAALARIARPDHAVITSIGREHLQHFGSLAAVEAEERALLEHVREDGLVLAPPFDEAELPGVPENFPLLGEHNRLYARIALAFADRLGVDRAAASAALENVTGIDGRLQLLRYGQLTVIHDAYNANPDSAAAALSVLRTMADGGWRMADGKTGDAIIPSSPSAIRHPTSAIRKVAILGDMLELGESAPAEHRALGALAASKADLVITIGELSIFTAAAAGTPHAFAQWSDDLPEKVAALLKPGDIVLLKASRGMRLERLLTAIKEGGET